MYEFDAGLAGARVVSVPRRADFSRGCGTNYELRITNYKWRSGESTNRRKTNDEGRSTLPAPRSTPKLLFLTSPNNPDGSLLAPDDLRRLLDLPLIVVLDEAYIEFAGLERSVARWVTERENLIVLRTFSKWAGIAGLRLGYGIFPSWLMPALWKAKQPYNVNVAATVAGLASLAHRAEIQTTVDALIVERERLLRSWRRSRSCAPIPARRTSSSAGWSIGMRRR